MTTQSPLPDPIERTLVDAVAETALTWLEKPSPGTRADHCRATQKLQAHRAAHAPKAEPMGGPCDKHNWRWTGYCTGCQAEHLDAGREARAKRFKAIVGPDDELDRILSMSNEEIIAETIRDGMDPEEVASGIRTIFERAVAMVKAEAAPLLDRLNYACNGACTCGTKTHEVRHHHLTCHFRLFTEAMERISPKPSVAAAFSPKTPLEELAPECRPPAEHEDESGEPFKFPAAITETFDAIRNDIAIANASVVHAAAVYVKLRKISPEKTEQLDRGWAQVVIALDHRKSCLAAELTASVTAKPLPTQVQVGATEEAIVEFVEKAMPNTIMATKGYVRLIRAALTHFRPARTVSDEEIIALYTSLPSAESYSQNLIDFARALLDGDRA